MSRAAGPKVRAGKEHPAGTAVEGRRYGYTHGWMLALLSSVLWLATGRQDGFPAAVQAVADRPNVFQTRKYAPTPLPIFAQSKALLPQPVIELHPEWIKLYWRAWELAFSHLKQPDPQSGFVSNFIDPAFNANTFQWDTCFMAQFFRYAEPAFHGIGSLDNFYAKQHPDGYICREIVRQTGQDFVFGSLDDTVNPPLFAWTEWQYYSFTGDKSRLGDVLPCLVKYYGWLKQNRRRPNGLYWNTGLGSGEDDLARKDTAYSWVDMSAQMVQNALNISEIARVDGELETSSYFRAEAQALAKQIDAAMWDPQTGFYYDLKQDGSITGIKTILGFWPLMAHMPNKDHAAALLGHFKNTNEFDRPDPAPALSADQPLYTADGQYWNGAVWAPTNYMLAKGLQDYGFEDDAERLSAKYLTNMSKVFADTGTIWENYAPEYAAGHGVQDMVGWSGLGPIAMLIENIIGIRVLGDQNRILWRTRMSGEMGVRNLMLGANHVSLIAAKESFGKRAITVTCEAPFTLNVNADDGKPLEFHINAGTTVLSVPALYAFTMNYNTRTADAVAYNLSIHHPVEASSQKAPENPPTNMEDGNPTTPWSSADGSPQSVKIDLGATHAIRAIDILWGQEFARAYSVEISTDGTTWTQAFHTAQGRGNREELDLQGRSFDARYVRLNCLAADGRHPFYSIEELQIWGH